VFGFKGKSETVKKVKGRNKHERYDPSPWLGDKAHSFDGGLLRNMAILRLLWDGIRIVYKPPADPIAFIRCTKEPFAYILSANDVFETKDHVGVANGERPIAVSVGFKNLARGFYIAIHLAIHPAMIPNPRHQELILEAVRNFLTRHCKEGVWARLNKSKTTVENIVVFAVTGSDIPVGGVRMIRSAHRACDDPRRAWRGICCRRHPRRLLGRSQCGSSP
jgi:hypothetical protein